MSLYAGGTKIGKLIGLESYDGTLKPENMQHGTVGYSKGVRVTGTGKCFEFAEYCLTSLWTVTDENGKAVKGVKFRCANGTNVFFIASTSFGDILLQTVHIAKIGDLPVEIGINNTTGEKVYAFYQDNYLIIYTNKIEKDTMLRIFYGKDNEI